MSKEGKKKSEKVSFWLIYQEIKCQDYYNGSWYAKSASTIAYNLARQISKEDKDLLWFWILGVTEMFQTRKHSYKEYQKEYHECEKEVQRLCPASKKLNKKSKITYKGLLFIFKLLTRRRKRSTI